MEAKASRQKQLVALNGPMHLPAKVDRHPGMYDVEVDGDRVVVKGIDNESRSGRNKGDA